MMTLQQAASMLDKKGCTAVLIGDSQLRFRRVHTDTRSLQPEDLFVALKGENFDAHDFLKSAKNTGCLAALAEHGLAEAGLSGLEVADAKFALGVLSNAWREQFDLPLIAVTGSNGKTTVTQMIFSILQAQCEDRAWSTKGNYNNDIGVPLTLLGLSDQHQMAVVEIGMNHPGEIAHLANLVNPTVAVVNNAQREHLEHMEHVEAVARENAAVITALPLNGIAIFPADDAYTSLWRQLAGGRKCMTFAMSGNADITGHADWNRGAWHVQAATPEGAVSYKLAIAGLHNVKNSLASVAASLAAGVPLPKIAEGLENFKAIKGRSKASTVSVQGREITLVDDSYNANPDSVRAAIDVLASLPAPHLLVLGDMGEVGNQGPEFHAEVGEYAADRGIENLFCLGDLMRYGAAVFPGARHFGGIDALNSAVLADLTHHRSVLVKGSRFMKMERVVAAIAHEVEINGNQNNKESLHAA